MQLSETVEAALQEVGGIILSQPNPRNQHPRSRANMAGLSYTKANHNQFASAQEWKSQTSVYGNKISISQPNTFTAEVSRTFKREDITKSKVQGVDGVERIGKPRSRGDYVA